ncbi:MAG: magnesium transporter CorA family protein [Candidatus Taylorbacteria bacterium]
MITTHTHRGLVWLDLESPNNEEIAGVIKRYGLHPLVGEELKSSPSRAKIDFYKDYIFIVITLPVRIREDGTYRIVNRELDFVIGKNFLITSRADTIEQVEYFGKIFDANAILNKDEKIEHAGHLFYYMIKRIYAGMITDLQNINDALEASEAHIFKGDEREMVEVLSNLNRELIDFKQTARIHRDIWEDMIVYVEKDLFGKEYVSYVRDIKTTFENIHELIANAHELIADLRETNDSLLDAKQSETMKILTIVAFIFYPLTFIASIFTIPASHVPLLDSPHGWTIIMGLMVLLAVGMWWVFKKKGWL